MVAQSRLHAVALQRQQKAGQSSQSHITRYVIFKSSLSLCRAFSFDIFHFPLSVSRPPRSHFAPAFGFGPFVDAAP